MLNHCFTGFQDMCPIDVVKPQQQIIWSFFDRLVHLSNLRWILTGEAGTIPTRSVHAYTVVVGTSPLTPTVIILRRRIGPEMSVKYVRQSLDAEIAAVVLVGRPGLH